MDAAFDARARIAAMAWVEAHADAAGGIITRQQLNDFVFEGEQIRLIDTGRGIRNPRQLLGRVYAGYSMSPSPE